MMSLTARRQFTLHLPTASQLSSSILILSLLAYISAGLLINIQHTLLGQIVINQRHLLLLALAAAGVAVATQQRVLTRPLPLVALAFFVWGLASLLVQEVWSASGSWQGRAVAYLLPVLIAGLTALMPRAPRLGALSRTVGGACLALLVGMGLAQWWLQEPLVWTGEKTGVWYPWVWQAYDSATGQLIVRAFSFFYTPVQYGVFCTAVALPLLAAVPRWRRWRGVPLPPLTLTLGLLALLGVYASANRTALAGALAGLVVVWGIKRAPRLIRIIPGLIVGVYVLLCGFLVFSGNLADFVGQLEGGGTLLETRNLLIRLGDYPFLLEGLTRHSDQLLYGVRDLPRLLTPIGARPDLSDFVPVDNEALFLALQFGLPGLLLMLGVMYLMARDAVQAWTARRSPYALGLLGLLMAWAVGACVNVVFIYLLPLACILLLLSRSRRN